VRMRMKNNSPYLRVEKFIKKLSSFNITVEEWQRQELLNFFNHYDMRVFIQNDYQRLQSMIVYQLHDYIGRWDKIEMTKANSLSNLQARYGEEEGLRRHTSQCIIKSQTHKSKLSKVDQFLKTNAVRICVPITNEIRNELTQLLNNLSQLGKTQLYDWQNTICRFINHGLDNYLQRVQKLMVLKTSTSLEAYQLRYGEELGYQKYIEITTIKVAHFPSSIKFWINKGYTEEEAVECVRISQTEKSKKSSQKIKGVRGSTARSIDFWLSRGLTLDEAQLKVKEIQTNGSLEKMIKKYGETEGKRRYLDANAKRTISLNKSDMKRGGSQIANNFFRKLLVHAPTVVFGKPEHIIKVSDRVFKVDGYHPDTTTVIEFFGDYWHANPSKYTSEDLITIGRHKIPAAAIWAKDTERLNLIEELGYRTIVIWESDYRKDPNHTISNLVSKLFVGSS